MEPISPVMPGSESIEVVYGKDQPKYIPLPAVYVENANSRTVVSRWRLTDQERAEIAAGADVVLQLLIPLNSDLTPSNLQIVMSDEAPSLIEGF
jgi:hypothetical protein